MNSLSTDSLILDAVMEIRQFAKHYFFSQAENNKKMAEAWKKLSTTRNPNYRKDLTYLMLKILINRTARCLARFCLLIFDFKKKQKSSNSFAICSFQPKLSTRSQLLVNVTTTAMIHHHDNKYLLPGKVSKVSEKCQTTLLAV